MLTKDMQLLEPRMITVSEIPRSVHIWGHFKWGSLEHTECIVSMVERREAHQTFTVNAACPREVQDEAWELFQLFRDGWPLQATHTVEFGRESKKFQALEEVR